MGIAEESISEVRRQCDVVRAFQKKAELVFDAIHDANDRLANTKLSGHYYYIEPRCGDTFVGVEVCENDDIQLKYYDSHYDSYCEESVKVPIKLFTFKNYKDISQYWYDLKVNEIKEEQERHKKAEAARKKLLAEKAREAKKKIKEKEYETYLKLKAKYEKNMEKKV